jgi:hypothetical protein
MKDTMKNLIILICIICLSRILYAQDATAIYNKTVNSTVTIETDLGLGSGFFVGKNMIVTNYHVIEGASIAYCYLNNSTLKFKIDGYLAYDKDADLIVLQVSGLNMPTVKLATGAVTPGQKIFVIGSPIGLPATISDGIVSGLRDFRGIKLIQITAPISHGSSGGPVLNSQGEVIGISVGQINDGQNLNFAIPKTNLEKLLNRKKSYSMPITSLNTSTIVEENQTYNYTGNEKIYKVGIFNNGNQSISLDYYANIGEYSLFFFTCLKSNEVFQRAISRNYRLVNVETGDIYYSVVRSSGDASKMSNFSNSASKRFCIWFDKIPLGVNLLSLMDGDCSGNSYCFLYINLKEYSEIYGFDINLYLNPSLNK